MSPSGPRGPLRGIFAPVTTPFGADGDLDERAWRANLTAHLASGVDGVVIAGSTGEAAMLDEVERHRLVEWARTVVDDRWLIVGTGAEGTRLCVRRCHEAGARGADAALVVAPHYYATAMTEAALHAHYLRVADESPVPVILYNIPKYMHFALSAPLVAELARHENVIGIKDSSGDLAMLEGFLAASGDSFAVLTGHAGTFARALELGARGGILAAALFAPALVRQVAAAHADGDAARGAAAQAQLGPLGAEVVGAMGVAGVKAALDAVGLVGGSPRLPLLPLDASGVGRVMSLLAAAGVEPLAPAPHRA